MTSSPQPEPSIAGNTPEAPSPPAPTPYVDASLCLPPYKLSTLVQSWLEEDCPALDAAAAAVGNAPRVAMLYAKSPLVLAGVPFFDAVLAAHGCTVAWHVAEGAQVLASTSDKRELATVSGAANAILLAERTALNALAECAAIATHAREAVHAARARAWHGAVAGTRKTAPGLRLVQKYAMLVAGMDPHRFSLSAMTMLKDNHIAASGDVHTAVRRARAVGGFALKVHVEAANKPQAVDACRAGADIVMLDNFEPAEFVRVARLVKQSFPHVLVEASGGISLDTLHHFLIAEADVISFSVNRYAKPVDLSLKIVPILQ